METVTLPVQKRRSRRKLNPEQKLAILQEWKDGLPMEEVCRKYSLAAQQVYKWRRDLNQGLTERGEMVPKSQVVLLQRRAEELERALGRKAMEVDVLKKTFELRGLKLPDGI